MKPEDELVPLPDKFREARDRLRVVGHELVRYTNAHARRVASRYRHPEADYEYAIHKIEFVDQKDGQIYIAEHAFYSSEQRVPEWVVYYVEKEKPAGFSLIKDSFTSPVHALITLVVPPYGLTLLGLVGAGEYMRHRDQKARRKELPRLSDIPKFCTEKTIASG